MPFRHAFRSLCRSPVFSLTVILSLSLGIGAVGTMFALVHGVLFAPLRYGDADRLISVGLRSADARRILLPPALATLWQREARRIVGMGISRTGNANLQRDGDDAMSERLTATWTSASLLPLLGVAPRLGRTFTPEEERVGGPNAVILGDALWRSHYGAAPDVLGRTLWINSVPRVIVGIMPADFAYPDADTRLWLPARPEHPESVGEFSYAGVARLAASATVDDARQELVATLPRLAEQFPRTDGGATTASWLAELRPTPDVRPLRESMTAGVAGTLGLLSAAAGLVLLVAWANLGNLVLIRSEARRQELAVRAALGAGRWRGRAPFAAEALLLCSTAGLLAIAFIAIAVRLLVATGPAAFPRLSELGVGPLAVALVGLIATFSALVYLLLPLLSAREVPLASCLADGGRATSAGQQRQRLSAGIATLQIALALVVSLGAIALLWTVGRLAAVAPGFDAEGVVTLRTQLPFARYGEAEAVAFYAGLVGKASVLPGVVAVGVTASVPLQGDEPLVESVRVPGEQRTESLALNSVDGRYFDALRIPVLAGRSFDESPADRSGAIVLSARAAGLLFGDPSGAAALGQAVALAPDGPSRTVIGVVGDVHDHDLAESPSARMYWPAAVAADPRREPPARRSMALVVRTSVAPESVVPALRRLVAASDPAVPVFAVATMSEVVAVSTARRTLAMRLVGAAAIVTLLLGAIGLYGVVACRVAMRRREFGVRLALGAQPRMIVRSVLLHGLALAAAGGVVGIVFHVVAVAPFLRAFLFGVTATDPIVVLSAMLLIGLSAVVASIAPAYQAARTDPTCVLRGD